MGGSLTRILSVAADCCYWANSEDGSAVNTNNLAAGRAVSYYNSAGVRVPNVTIPKGSTIISANLNITWQNVTGTPSLIVRGELAANAGQVANSTDGRARVRGTKSISINCPPPSLGDLPGLYTYDVKTLVQEIVNQSGWSSGNALHLIFDDNGGGVSEQLSAGAYAVYVRWIDIVYGDPPRIIPYLPEEEDDEEGSENRKGAHMITTVPLFKDLILGAGSAGGTSFSDPIDLRDKARVGLYSVSYRVGVSGAVGTASTVNFLYQLSPDNNTANFGSPVNGDGGTIGVAGSAAGSIGSLSFSPVLGSWMRIKAVGGTSGTARISAELNLA